MAQDALAGARFWRFATTLVAGEYLRRRFRRADKAAGCRFIITAESAGLHAFRGAERYRRHALSHAGRDIMRGYRRQVALSASRRQDFAAWLAARC